MVVFGITNNESPGSTASEMFKIYLSMHEFVLFRNILISIMVIEVIPYS
jgi:hypothetical protein